MSRVIVLTGGIGAAKLVLALTYAIPATEHCCVARVRSLHFAGADAAQPAPGIVDALLAPDTKAILVAPSNPYLSIDPILAVPGIRAALAAAEAPVVAVSPVVGGQAVEGPTARMMTDFGLPVAARSIADHYRGVIDGIVAHEGDVVSDLPCLATDTLMNSLKDRIRVAEAPLELAWRLSS